MRTIAGGQQVLATAYAGRQVVALTGRSPSGQTCCSDVAVGEPSSPGFGAGAPLVTGLGGATQGMLVPVGPRLLAVIATERGVWAALSARGGRRFSRARRLSGPRELPQAVAAIPRADGGEMITWSARTATVTGAGPNELSLAQAGPGNLPARARVLLRVPAARSIDEVALAAGPQPALTWIEGYSDARGFHSVVRAAGLTSPLRPATISDSQDLAAGLAAAGSASGPQLLAWQACTSAGGCQVEAATAAGTARGFSRIRRLGQASPGEAPVAAVTSGGVPLVAWVDSGGVEAVTGARDRLGRRRRLFGTAYASQLSVAAGPSGGAVLAWVNGTARERVLAVSFSPF